MSSQSMRTETLRYQSVQMWFTTQAAVPSLHLIIIVCSQLIMSRDQPTLKGPYLPYTKHRVDWQAIFDDISAASSSRPVKAIAAKWGVQYETLRRRWKKYQRGLEVKDENLIAIARGVVDGRRDNHRIFSREEEAVLRSAINQENVHPNKPVIQRLAIGIHKALHYTLAPAANTRSHPHADLPFHASAGFVERIKHEFDLSPQKPKVRRRYVKKKGKLWEEERLSMAIVCG